jgi:hypothetical protein
MVTGVVLGVFIIPVLFIIFQHLQEKITGTPKVIFQPHPVEPLYHSEPVTA